MGKVTVGDHLCIVRIVNMHKINNLFVKLLKLVYIFAIGAVPFHDVATREKHLLGSEHVFVHSYTRSAAGFATRS